VKKILIANRGEIALRVLRTCNDMGINTVTLYTDEEVDLPHAKGGDESVNLGSGALSETYLNIDKIVDICKKLNVDGVHPGYGFLSERSTFANALEKAGIKLIGPPVSAMEAMGDKKTSKVMMEEAGIPLIPGYHGESQDDGFLKKESKKIGYPILIKASAGGGGKGMRIVKKESDFQSALESAKREAMNAFGDDKVLLEKYITSPRHIEVQVVSDGKGNHFHFFERECSIQRRYQKVVEESPSTALSDKLRSEMCATAVKISSYMNYVGAGTIEYILDTDGKFYFLEMNTRLQVEHPITEMVTGHDLVRLQIIAARGEAFSFKQEDIKQCGHAIETRIYAENPYEGFLPSVGKISVVGKTSGDGVRLDTGYRDGNVVTISFDPMLAKLITYGATRDQAIEKMISALCDIPFLGVMTNREYLDKILSHKAFKAGDTFTHFIETYKDDLAKNELTNFEKALAIASYYDGLANDFDSIEMSLNPWNDINSFRNV
jgi:3-methylcrotonyl-CoA carboxylase alpha subunit